MMFKAAILFAVFSIIVAAGLWVINVRLQEENDRLRREVAVFQAQAKQAAEARDVLRAHLRREEAEAAAFEQALAETRKMEGADAPMSAYERAVLDHILRP